MIWVLFFITIGSQNPIDEFGSKKECMAARAEYTKGSHRDEIFVCRKQFTPKKSPN